MAEIIYIMVIYRHIDPNTSDEHTASIFFTENGETKFLEINGTHLQDTWHHNPEGKGKCFPHACLKGVWRSGCLILVLDRLVSCPSHFTSIERTPKSPMNRFGGTQNQFRCFGKEVNLLHLLEVKLQFICCPACSLLIILTMLTQLLKVILVHDKALTSCEKHILCSRMPQNQTNTPLVI
jgi:hypothetical protein